MGKGICKMRALCAIALLCSFILISANAAEYIVGDRRGWNFQVADWPRGKNFKAGDVLVFQYNPTFHNVAILDKEAYQSCQFPSGAPVHQTGNDRITIPTGQSYYICTLPGHCEGGMKIAINAS